MWKNNNHLSNEIKIPMSFIILEIVNNDDYDEYKVKNN